MSEQTENPNHHQQLYAEDARSIKAALDYFSHHLEEAAEHLQRISELRQFSETRSGMGAVQVEVAAIILYNQMTFVPGKK
ncbi:MAG: hypothetical protein IGS03_05950 [Candidatus Sericytochromatia bacterium]|nr:hypothetical protein [Candidatus Sericytochromatia bacterium]